MPPSANAKLIETIPTGVVFMQPNPLDENELERICERFSKAWRDGENPRIEDYVQPCADPLRTALLPRLVRLEWKERKKRGEPLNANDLNARFPQLHGLIRSLAVEDESILLTRDLPFEQGINQITLVSSAESTRRDHQGGVKKHDGNDAVARPTELTAAWETMNQDATFKPTGPPSDSATHGPAVNEPAPRNTRYLVEI